MKRATVAIIFFSLVGCTQTQSNPAESKVTPDKSSSSSWPGGMQQMAKSLNKLMPYVFSQTEFAEEKNRKKIQGLIERNKYLQESAPKNKQIALKNLEFNLVNLEREKHLNALKIQHIEEDIIRKGCPGINLME